jgi:C4-dicarboxylate transporter, DcuC family
MFSLTVVVAMIVMLLVVAAILRGIDVRLTLFSAALVIAAAAGDVTPIIRKFLDTFSDEKFVLPICSAMGFAYVLKHTGCDAHLVRVLMVPVRRIRGLILPGVVAVAFVVNIPVISQTSTAVCVGPVAIPLLRAAGYSPTAIAATLVLGASMGGELLNPGAPELQTISRLTGTSAVTLSRVAIPEVLFAYAITALLVFWLINRRDRVAPSATSTHTETQSFEPINPFKVLVPIVPLAILFITGPPWYVVRIPTEWLAVDGSKYDARLIAIAMLIGVAAAALATPSKAKDSFKQFFEGAGYGFATIVSIIVTANCFGEALRNAGLAKLLGSAIQDSPALLTPLALFAPWLFAMISGSGMASTQSLFESFYKPAIALETDPDAVGALVSVGSAAGRTMSPVAAVVLMCGTLTGASTIAIIRRTGPPLVIGLIVAGIIRMVF